MLFAFPQLYRRNIKTLDAPQLNVQYLSPLQSSQQSTYLRLYVVPDTYTYYNCIEHCILYAS